jgi:hypothetical protein
MVGATETNRGPVVAPVGIVIVILVSLHELTVSAAPLRVAMLLPCVEPNPLPVIATWLPILPVVADRLVITGAGDVAELIDTLSNVAVATAVVDPLLTARPM